jgi:hypothetical protein
MPAYIDTLTGPLAGEWRALSRCRACAVPVKSPPGSGCYPLAWFYPGRGHRMHRATGRLSAGSLPRWQGWAIRRMTISCQWWRDLLACFQKRWAWRIPMDGQSL